MHILLPQPPSPDSKYNLEIYASTGFPLFLNEILERGASRENLKACVAGGALVGPLSHQDISLDIGGRTVEIIVDLLEKEAIEINNMEIGGFFSCILNLNAATFETSISPIETSFPSSQSLQSPIKLTKPTPESIRATVDQLQPIPQVALKILRLLHDDDQDFTGIANELRRDQVLAGKVVSVCNSSMFAGNIRIDFLNAALLLLGKSNFIKTIISAAVDTFYNQSGSGYSLCKGGLYHHAVGTAIIAEQIALLTGKVPPSTAYIAGLLHDIGMVVLDQHLAPHYPLFYRELQMDGCNMLELEKKHLGMDHCTAGRELSNRWNLPPVLSEAIYFHHRPEEAVGNEISRLPFVIYLADLIMSRFNSGLSIERLEIENLKLRMHQLDLPLSEFHELLHLIPVDVFRASP